MLLLDAMRSAPSEMSLLAERTIEEAKAKGVLIHRDIYAVRLELAAALPASDAVEPDRT